MHALFALAAAALPPPPKTPQAVEADDQVEIIVSGNLRSRSEIYAGRPFGKSGPGDDEYILWRALISSEVRFGKVVAAHIQLGWHNQTGRNGGPAPTDRGDVDIRKAYVDLKPLEGVQIRVGRQEVTFGSSRLVSARDGPNIRRVFDGGLLEYRQGQWRAQGFVVRPVEDRPDAFDDRSNDDQRFAGIYLTRQSGKNGVDLYFMDLRRNAGTFGSLTAKETRRSLGVRIFGESQGLDYNFEVVGQNGRFGRQSIQAWTVASDTGFTLEQTGFRPRLGLKLNMTSGDRNAADYELETFNPLFPNLSYFNEAALLAPQNHIDIHPSIALTFSPKLQASAGAIWFWKSARDDDIYRGPGIPVGARAGSRTIGRQIDLNLIWRPHSDVELKTSYVRFDTGAALKNVSGNDTNFAMFSVQKKF